MGTQFPTHPIFKGREAGMLGSLSLAQRFRLCHEPQLRLSAIGPFDGEPYKKDQRCWGPHSPYSLDLGKRSGLAKLRKNSDLGLLPSLMELSQAPSSHLASICIRAPD